MTKTNATIIIATLLAGCAQDVGDVDRTQPNRLRKSLFDGEWYHQKTTYDVPYTAGFTFTGETSELERVKWQIEEGFLIAYRSYDLVENTQRATQLADVDFKGAPIAAYAISSHFDVIREYNALTGEETNVIYENNEDRPWYEREYIRVDWSKNLVINFNFLDDGVDQSPINYYVQDRADADRLLLGVNAEGTWTDHQDWEAIAKLESADYIDIVDTIFANPTSIAFDDGYGGIELYPECWFYAATDCQPARVKIRSSYMKVDPTAQFEAMAYPDTAIARDGTGTAVRDAQGDLVRIPWFDKFGYFRVERDHYDRDRELVESARTFLINRWGIWNNAPACKVGNSYENCIVRPIVYHLSPEFPTTLVPAARRAVAQWNEAFKDVVNHLKYKGQKSLDQVEDVFVLQANSFVPGETRGERIGDLRYSYIYYVPEPQIAGPLGYGPSAVDPLTGRIVHASAYVYGAGLESWATWGADIVALINGQISTKELIEGEDVRAYVARVRGDYAAQASLTMAEAKQFAGSRRVTEGRAKQKRITKRGMRLDRGKIRAKLSAIEDTQFEERLLTDEIVRALRPETRGAGDSLVASLSPNERARISPARWGTRGAMRAHRDKRQLKLRLKNIMMARDLDDAVFGLAERLKGETDRTKVRASILESVFASTTEHEIGHTLGLRHNFSGSYDSLNYHPHYWELRGNNPSPMDPVTDEQRRQGMREYQYASIMDYGARFTSDIHGIGNYDKAAIRFGYGQLVEVFENPPNEPLAGAFDSLQFALHEMRHYTSFPRLFGGDAANIYRRRLVPYQQVIDQRTGVAMGDLAEVPYRFCSDEYDGALAWCNTYDDGADPYEITVNASEAYENYYIFNSFARDQREVDPWYHLDKVYFRYMIFPQLQYQHWVFKGWDFRDLWEGLRANSAATWGIEDVPFDQAADGGLSGAAASRVGLNFLGRVIQAPEPGAYYQDPDDSVFYNYSYDTDLPLCPPGQSADDCSDLNIDLGPGKYAFSLYEGESGYYFYERLHAIGSFYDKLAAIQTITSPETNFLGIDADADLTQYAISMHLYFPEEVTRLVGGSAMETYDAYAGVINGQQQYTPRDMFAPAATYAGMAPVDPATSFTVELYAAWLGMAFLNASYDNSFNDLMRVFVEGNGEGLTPTVTDPERVARFVHPRTGRTFIGIRHEDANKFSPGFEMVRRTQARADDPNLTQDVKDYYIESAVSIMETIRGLDELYGKLYF